MSVQARQDLTQYNDTAMHQWAHLSNGTMLHRRTYQTAKGVQWSSAEHARTRDRGLECASGTRRRPASIDERR